MISLAIITAAASLGLILCGYLLGRAHAVRVAARRRGGILHPSSPKQMVDRWNFPQAPRLYDQETEPRASVGHPLVPDVRPVPSREEMAAKHDAVEEFIRTHEPDQTAMTDASLRSMAAALDATHEALDPHSRRVPTAAEEYRRLKPGKASEL